MSRVESSISQTIDPFYLYLDLVAGLSAGQIFLLDAATEHAHADYPMSVVGVCPVIEIQVKDGCVSIIALSGLADYLEQHLTHAGFQFKHTQSVPDEQIKPSAIVHAVYLQIHQADPLAALECVRLSLRTLLSKDHLPPFCSGFLGYIGYDAVQYLETLPKTTRDDRNLPDVRLQFHAGLIQLLHNEVTFFDASERLSALLSPQDRSHLKLQMADVKRIVHNRKFNSNEIPILLKNAQFATTHSTSLVGESMAQQASVYEAIPAITEDVTEATFKSGVQRAIRYIEVGDIFQVVLSKRMRIHRRIHPYVAYNRLRKVNPSPYMFMAEYPDMRLFGTSPEVQFRAVGGMAEMKPLAGTSKGRGKSASEDEEMQAQLRSNLKECAEHVMLVDLCRNDLGRISKSGSVRVTEFMAVERYSHLFHLVSQVEGELKPDVSVFHALLATFPAGTLTGAPKIRAMEIIDELEQYRRGPYGGLIGMIDLDANTNTAIIIRTVVDTGDSYYVQVGAGIVADSNPDQEWQECSHKAGALIQVLAGQ